MSKSRTFFLLLTALVAAGVVRAQESPKTDVPGDFPPNATPGKCYARCYIPERFETYTEQVTSKPPSKRIEVVPATYESLEEQVLVRPGYKKLEAVPAVLETVTEQELVKEASKRVETVPAVYEDVTEEVEIAPPSTRWVRGKADPTCVSSNPDDCRVWCLETVPAKKKAVKKRVLKTPATTREVEIPAEYKAVTKTVVKTPATTREIEVPPVYTTVRRTKVKTPAATREVEIPPEYETVTKTRLTQKGGYLEWREVLCARDVTVSRVHEIQDALRGKGYDPGPTDNVLGPRTLAALKKYQEDNGLPMGGLNDKTMEALGIK